MNIWMGLAEYASFDTERLLLRPFNYADAEDFYLIASNPDNLEFIFPLQATLYECQFVLANYFMKQPLGVWAIEDKTTRQMIGSIKLEHINLEKLTAEVGYFLSKACWGQGLMTEALQALTYLALEEMGFSALHLVAHQENLASQRVAEKAGFKLYRQYKGSDRYTKKMRAYVEYQIK